VRSEIIEIETETETVGVAEIGIEIGTEGIERIEREETKIEIGTENHTKIERRNALRSELRVER